MAIVSPPDLQQRIVLLGASNLTRGISTIVETAQHVWNGPLDVLACLGHGRSYGQKSSVLGRALPGIIKSKMWEEIARREPLPIAALVTDIGNDLIYEAPVDAIVDWVRTCFDRLCAAEAKVVVTLLPVDVIPRVRLWQFLAIRTVMFPRSRIRFEEIANRAHALNDAVRKLAEERGIAAISQPADWYGLDPIHIRRPLWRSAWPQILSAWNDERDVASPAGSMARWLYLQSLLPEQRWLFGVSQQRIQPIGRLRDGTHISYY